MPPHSFEPSRKAIISLPFSSLRLTLFPPLTAQAGNGLLHKFLKPIVSKLFPEYSIRKQERKLWARIKIFSSEISKHGDRLQNLSQSRRSLRENFLWIGEVPIQSKPLGLIFPLKKLGQKPDPLIFMLREL